MIFGNHRITIAATVEKMGISVAHPWWKLIVEQPSLHHTHSTQMDYN
jgi:hypothetical protein